MHDDDNFDGYEKDPHDHIQDGYHDKENVELKIVNEPPSIEFHPVIAPTIPPQTQRTFEQIRKMMLTGVILVIMMGVTVVGATGTLAYLGIEYERLENQRMERIIEEIRLQKYRQGANDSENGAMPFTPPKGDR